MTGTSGGKHGGSRRGPRPARRLQPALLLLALGVTACIVAWGYLVYAAIDFGSSARSGDSTAWWFLALASVGAVACLFIGLMLVAAITRRLGITGGLSPKPTDGEPPRPVGGRTSGPLTAIHPFQKPRGAGPVPVPPLVFPGSSAGVEAAGDV